jgi:hypothetical protein
MEGQTTDTKLEVLIQSVKNLSEITCNHDKILTKLVDDHEMRIRELTINCGKYEKILEKHIMMERASEEFVKTIDMDKRLRVIEQEGSRTAEVALTGLEAIKMRVGNLENWRWYAVGVVVASFAIFEIYLRLN